MLTAKYTFGMVFGKMGEITIELYKGKDKYSVRETIPFDLTTDSIIDAIMQDIARDLKIAIKKSTHIEEER